MRIEIDDATEKALDEIKFDLGLYGKGHTNTVAGLIEHFKQTRAINKAIDAKLERIPAIITNSFQQCARNFAYNLFKDPEK